MFGAALLGRGEVWSGAAFNLAWAAVMIAIFALGVVPAGAFGAALAIAGAYLWMMIACALVLPRRWSVPVSSLASPLLGAPLVIGAGAWLALREDLPAAVSVGGCLALAAASLALWSLRVPSAAPDRTRD